MRLLLTSDLHLRDDRPRCRIDTSWTEEQSKMLRDIIRIAFDEDVEAVLITGDIFHRPKVSPRLESMFISEMSCTIPVFIMPGQHDLPGHSMSRIGDSSFGVLWNHAEINTDDGGIHHMDDMFAWEEFQGEERAIRTPKISPGEPWSLVIGAHRLVTPDGMVLPVKTAETPTETLSAIPEWYKIIVAGDYHRGHEFTAGKRSSFAGRQVIVPGCASIQAADLIDYEPTVVIFDDTESLHRVPLYHNREGVQDEYLKEEKKRVNFLESFISATKESKHISLSFEDNLKETINDPEVPERVTEEIHLLMGW